MNKKVLTIMCSLVILLFFKPHLLFCDENEAVNDNKNFHNKIYISLIPLNISGVQFPNRFSTGGIGSPEAYLNGNEKISSSFIGFALGYSIKEGKFVSDIEFDFCQVDFLNGAETESKQVYSSEWGYETIENTYVQDQRKIQLYSLVCDMGGILSRSFPVAILGTFGLGYSRKTFHSDYCDFNEDSVTFQNLEDEEEGAGLGKYKGNGNWSRSDLSIIIGLGLKYFLKKQISIKLDYKYFWGMKKSRVYPSPDLYMETGEEFTIGHRIGVCFSYYF